MLPGRRRLTQAERREVESIMRSNDRDMERRGVTPGLSREARIDAFAADAFDATTRAKEADHDA